MPNDEYKLVFWFDSSESSENQIKTKVSNLVEESLSSIEVNTEKIENIGIKAEISGLLEEVDCCHINMRDTPLSESYVLIRDETSQKLREKAYPILADIETTLREFVHKKMIEVKGFDWWKEMIPEDLRENPEKTMNKDKNRAKFHHPLEYINFEDLVNIITETNQSWGEEKLISISELKYLLDESQSLSDVREKLLQKTEEKSLWDEVFSKYIDDKTDWKEIRDELKGFVIKLRHRVMHHRTVHKTQLTKLESFKDKFDCLINSAKTRLEEQELQEAQESLALMTEPLASSLVLSLTKSMQQMKQIQEPYLRAVEQMKQIQEPYLRAVEQMKKFKRFQQKSESDENENQQDEENNSDED